MRGTGRRSGGTNALHVTLRPYLGVAPLALAIALAAHFACFGDDHAFGGRLPWGLDAALAAGLAATLALSLRLVLMVAGTGAARAAIVMARLPGGGTLRRLAAALAAMGIAGLALVELVEGTPPVQMLPALIAIAIAAPLAAWCLRRCIAWFCAAAVALCERGRFVARSPGWPVALPPQAPIARSVSFAYARFSRPPPHRH